MMLWKLYSLLIAASKRLSRRGIYPFLEEHMSSIPAGSKVLAVGAGGPTAELARRLAREKGFSLTLFDVSTEYKTPDVLGDICTHDFGGGEIFRLVVMSEVLEHLHAPGEALSRVHGALERDGVLLLTVPFIFPLHDRPRDYFRFTRYGLELLLKEFRDVTVRERNSWAEAINVLLARLVLENRRSAQIAAPFALAFAFLLVPVARLAAWAIPTDFLTTGYLVRARKQRSLPGKRAFTTMTVVSNPKARLVYLANLRVPSEKAHVLQTFKNCEAFAALDLDVLLAHPRRRRSGSTEGVEDPFEYYGVRAPFALREVPCPDLVSRPLPPFLSHAAFLVHSVLFTRRVLRGEELSGPEVLLYTRDFFVATVLSLSGYRFVFEAHTIPRGPVGPWMRWLAAHSVGLVVITRELERELLGLGLPADKILVAPDAVDERWIDEPPERADARSSLEIPAARPLAVYSGHLYAWKGIDTVLDAAARLPRVLFCILGGMASDVERVQKRVRELSLGNVRLEGHVAHRRVPIYLAAADVLLLPNSGRVPISARHTSPLKAFEYMAAGRPVVASDLPSLREIFENEQNALLVAPDDGDALARGIERVLSDGALSERLATAARRRVRSHTWRRRAEAILRFARERGGWSRATSREAVSVV